MENKKPHVLKLSHTHSSGTEEWICPTCGRLILIDWHGLYRSTILVPGDAQASHIGGCQQAVVSANMDAVVLNAARFPAEEPCSFELTEAMRPWLRWMQSAGLADSR